MDRYRSFFTTVRSSWHTIVRRLRLKRAALLIMPQTILLKHEGRSFVLNSIQELPQFKLLQVDVFIDGFPQSFKAGSIPLVRFFDRRSALYHKLSASFRKSLVFGGVYEKEKNSLRYAGFGFDQSPTLMAHLRALNELKVPIRSVKSLVFLAALMMLPFCVSKIGAQSLLWISSYLEGGYRLVFYQSNEIKFVRTIQSHKDLLLTLTYINNEYNVDTHDLSIFMTLLERDEYKALKEVFQSSKIYTWKINPPSQMEFWLISYIQGSPQFSKRVISESLLSPLILKTRIIQKIQCCLQAVCMIFGVLLSTSVFSWWRLEKQLSLAQKALQATQTQVAAFKKHLKVPPHIDAVKFRAYLNSVKDLHVGQDPFKLISIVAEHLPPEILIREILWRKEPKNLLKLSIRFLSLADEDKKEILNEFKNNLFESLTKKSNIKFSVDQTSSEILELDLS